MNIQVLSDLHLDFHRDGGRGFLASLDPSGVDVLVLAGDLAEVRSPVHAPALAVLCARYPHVVYVAGNHEYYGLKPAEVAEHRTRLSAKLPNLHWLDDSHVDLGGLTFVGATLWFPDLPGNDRYRMFLSDFSCIEDFEPWVYERHAATRTYLGHALRPGAVLVTHHLPHPLSVHPKFANSALNRFFLGDIGDVLQARRPALAIHGHTHERLEYVTGRTRIVCNPLGYPGEAHAEAFVQRLVLPMPSLQS